jgi:flagellar biosynthetic protein FliP
LRPSQTIAVPQTPLVPPQPIPTPAGPVSLPDVSTPANFGAALQLIILLTVLSLAPSILIMMTSFTRIIIVLSLLRQALGTQQLPPNQILIGLSLFMTFIVMGPTFSKVNQTALQPYLNGADEATGRTRRGRVPLRDFMIRRSTTAENSRTPTCHDFANPPPDEPPAELQWKDFHDDAHPRVHAERTEDSVPTWASKFTCRSW